MLFKRAAYIQARVLYVPFLIVGHLLEPFGEGRVVGKDVSLVEAFLEHGRRHVLLQDVVAREARHFGEISARSSDDFRQLQLTFENVQLYCFNLTDAFL